MAIIGNRTKIISKQYEIYRCILFCLKKSILMILIIISLSLIYSKSSFSKKTFDIGMEATGPFVKGSTIIYEFLIEIINYIPKTVFDMHDVSTENDNLKREIISLRNTVRELQNINNENIYLKRLLNVTSNEKETYVVAKLLSITNNPFNRIALIEAGEKHGLKIDQIVTNDIGLVGKIVEVSSNYAKVMLVNDYNSRIPIVTSITSTKGILFNKDNVSKLEYLPENHSIQLNEEILTSGDGKIYPPGIFVAKIKEIDQNNVLVKTLDNLTNTKFVVIHIMNTEN